MKNVFYYSFRNHNMVLLAGLCVLLVTVCNMASALTHLEEQPLWYDRRSDVTGEWLPRKPIMLYLIAVSN